MITNLEVLGGGGSGPASAGVKSLNGQKGDLNLKTLNGNDILGEGDVKVVIPLVLEMNEEGTAIVESDDLETLIRTYIGGRGRIDDAEIYLIASDGSEYKLVSSNIIDEDNSEAYLYFEKYMLHTYVNQPTTVQMYNMGGAKPEVVFPVIQIEDEEGIHFSADTMAFTEFYSKVKEFGGFEYVNVVFESYTEEGDPMGDIILPTYHVYTMGDSIEDTNMTFSFSMADFSMLCNVAFNGNDFVFDCQTYHFYSSQNPQVVVLSQEEYDALPEEEKNNGTIYAIQ